MLEFLHLFANKHEGLLDLQLVLHKLKDFIGPSRVGIGLPKNTEKIKPHRTTEGFKLQQNS